ALFTTGAGAFIRLGPTTGFTANVGTIDITTKRNQDTGATGYFALTASTGTLTTSTLTFANSGSGTGFILNMATFDVSGSASYQSNSFYVGAGNGTIITNNSEALAIQVAQKQRLNYYSTIQGTGSITFDSVVHPNATSGDIGELTLGFGRGPFGSTTAQ